MNHKINIIIICLILLILLVPTALAHVPYIERQDYSEQHPMHIWKMIEYSKAFYAWLETDYITPCKDIDVYTFTIRNHPVEVYIELIVPEIEDFYVDFVPWFALVGPDLPAPNVTLPFTLPPGYGAIVKENVVPGEERDTFYEPFGGKWYYNGPILDMNISQSGTYYVYCWDPYEHGGDYVMVIGKGEFFGPIDIFRAIINTLIIRRNGELHLPSLKNGMSIKNADMGY
jgi:hypothetical protein